MNSCFDIPVTKTLKENPLTFVWKSFVVDYSTSIVYIMNSYVGLNNKVSVKNILCSKTFGIAAYKILISFFFFFVKS